MTVRGQRMVDSAPDYYQDSKMYTGTQESVAAELNTVDTNNDDLALQRRIITATWGLKYWEAALGIKTVEADGYEIRRSRVLSKWRGAGNFSAALIKSICEAFSNGEVAVIIDIPAQQVTIKFIGSRGIPPNMSDLEAMVENVIHAHLGTTYQFTYMRWDELDAHLHTWNDIDTRAMTWDVFEIWTP